MAIGGGLHCAAAVAISAARAAAVLRATAGTAFTGAATLALAHAFSATLTLTYALALTFAACLIAFPTGAVADAVVGTFRLAGGPFFRSARAATGAALGIGETRKEECSCDQTGDMNHFHWIVFVWCGAAMGAACNDIQPRIPKSPHRP